MSINNFVTQNPLLGIVLTVLVATAGAFIAKKLHIPIPFMLGAMIGVAAYNIFTGSAMLPAKTKFFTQSVSGVLIGLSLTRKDVRNLKELIGPALILVVCFLFFTASVGLLMNKVFGFDPATSFLICVPGGVVDISLMAYDLNANPAIVSFVQSFRLFFVYLIFPVLITWVSKKTGTGDGGDPLSETDVEVKETFIDRIIPDNRVVKHIVTLACGLIGAWIGTRLGLPAGALSCSMVAVILLNMNSQRAMFDRKYKKAVQVIAGGLIGSSITMETVVRLPSVFLPTVVLMICYVAFNFLISFLMRLTKRIDFVSAMFASSPGGASDMALIASDLGGQSPKIAILQIVRLISVYTIFPFLVKFMIGLVS